MYSSIELNKLTRLENAIFVCFGDAMEENLPQVETQDDALVDALQDVEDLTRSEAECQLHGQIQ